MVDELFQGWGGQAGTANAIMSSTDYLSQAAKSFNNIEDGFYISPAFLDKITIHVAKNFMDLPKIKVPLILGIWGGKGQVRKPAAGAEASLLSSILIAAAAGVDQLAHVHMQQHQAVTAAVCVLDTWGRSNCCFLRCHCAPSLLPATG